MQYEEQIEQIKGKSNNEFNVLMTLSDHKKLASAFSVLHSHFEKQFKIQGKSLVCSQELIEQLEQELDKLKKLDSPNAPAAFLPTVMNIENLDSILVSYSNTKLSDSNISGSDGNDYTISSANKNSNRLVSEFDKKMVPDKVNYAMQSNNDNELER